MASLNDYLTAEENVLDQFVPVYYSNNETYCAITTRRLLFYKKETKDSFQINLESIEDVSLEKGWQQEIFFFMNIFLALGLVWLILGIISYLPSATFLTSPTREIINGLTVPGGFLTAIGVVAAFYYFTRVKAYLLISTPDGSHQLYAEDGILSNLSRLLSKIVSKEINFIEWEHPPELSQAERLKGVPLTEFNDIKVTITFKDENLIKQTIKAKCGLVFKEKSVQMIANNLELFRNRPSYQAILKSEEIPFITEENLYQILEISHFMKVTTYILFDINFDLKKMFLDQEKSENLVSSDVFLSVSSRTGTLQVTLSKHGFLSGAPSADLTAIETLIKEMDLTNL